MSRYEIAVVGTGPGPESERSGTGFSMGYRHGRAYEQLDECELIACADVVPEHADQFAAEFGLEPDRAYESHAEMLAGADPDVVSVAVPPASHAEIVVDCARHGSVSAIHCEKPMADTWGASRLMAQECHRSNVQLTFNHQLRFHGGVRKAKELLDGGEIGRLERIEASRANLYDAGTHQIDLCNYFNDDRRPEWVIGQIDYREETLLFGEHNTNQALSMWEYENGVHALASTGAGAGAIGGVGGTIRLRGTGGTIRLGGDPYLRIQRADDPDWQTPEWSEREWVPNAIEHVVGCLEGGSEPTLGARKALNATEIIFGTYESARRRGRVDLPLEVEDNPLRAMVEAGTLDPAESSGG